jgi:MscS family membrane protein
MESIKEFWEIVVDVWQKGLFGVDIGQIVAAVLIFFGFFLLRPLFSRVVIRRVKALTEKTKTSFDDEVLEVIERPIGFVPVVLGTFFAVNYLSLTGEFQLIADRIIRSLIVFVIFWNLVKLVQPLSLLIRQLEKVLTVTMVDWLVKAIKVLFIFIGAATILEIWGIKIGPILAGLGLFGVAIALGAQDLFKNLISGILVIAEKRFHPGDWIRVEGVVEGTVETVGFRSTFVRRFDKAPVYVPNSKLSDNSVINFSAMTHRRIYWVIGVEYRTTIKQLRQIRDNIEQYILDSEEFARPPEVPTFVRIDRFGDSSIDMMVYCFTKTTVWGEWLRIKERLAYKIKEIVQTAGTSFAFPSQSLYVAEIPSERAERFVPPSKRSGES